MLLKTRTLMLAATAVSLLLLAGCQAREEKKMLITSGRISIGPASDYPAGSASTKFLATHGIVITNSSGDPIAVRAARGPKDSVTWDDTHHEFVSADEENHYDLVGRPVEGTEKRPLSAIRAEKNPDGTLSVDLTKLYSMPMH